MKGGIEIKKSHLNCLADGQYLNDIIIDFYLKYVIEEIISESDRRRTHLFSSYFFSRLTDSKEGKIQYSSVRKWTKNINIFEKDFLMIPINQK